MNSEEHVTQLYNNDEDIKWLPALYRLQAMGHDTVQYIYLAWYIEHGTSGMLIAAVCCN